MRLVRLGEDFDSAGIDSFLDTSQYSETHVQYMSSLFHAFRRNYIPKPYAGRAVLYLAKIRPPIHLLELDLAWQSIASDLEMVRVPGTHIGLIKDPNVQVMAADLKRRMALLSRFVEAAAARGVGGEPGMRIIGISGLANAMSFKRSHWPGLDEREYRISQGHDSAAALVSNGEILAAAAEERFSLKKHSGDFPLTPSATVSPRAKSPSRT